jgi:hypothetical protein
VGGLLGMTLIRPERGALRSANPIAVAAAGPARAIVRGFGVGAGAQGAADQDQGSDALERPQSASPARTHFASLRFFGFSSSAFIWLRKLSGHYPTVALVYVVG